MNMPALALEERLWKCSRWWGRHWWALKVAEMPCELRESMILTRVAQIGGGLWRMGLWGRGVQAHPSCSEHRRSHAQSEQRLASTHRHRVYFSRIEGQPQGIHELGKVNDSNRIVIATSGPGDALRLLWGGQSLALAIHR